MISGTQPVLVGNGTRPEIPLSCPTSNCTFPEYESLAVCSKCVDISEMLQFNCRESVADWIPKPTYNLSTSRYIYPNISTCGYYLNSTSQDPILVSGYTTTTTNISSARSPAGQALLLRMMPLMDQTRAFEAYWGGSINFKNTANIITDGIIVAASDGIQSVYQNKTPIARECVLAWCVQRIRSSYQYATYREDIVSSFIESGSLVFPETIENLSPEINGTTFIWKQNVTIIPPTGETTFGVSNATHASVAGLFHDMFPSYLTMDDAAAKTNYRYRAHQYGPFYRRTDMKSWFSPNNMTRYYERIATTLTNQIRSSDSNEMIQGLAYEIETYINVHWGWLAFPLALLLLCMSFLIATIVKTSKAIEEKGPGVWKTSTMPALLYSLPSDTRKQFNGPEIAGKTSENARKLRVKLHPEKGWRVSGQVYSPTTPVIVYRSNQPPPGWI